MTDSILFKELAGLGGDLGLITLNRPQALNALNQEMVAAMQQQLQTWAHKSSIKAVVIQAAPGRAFCAGGDLRAIYDACVAKDPAAIHFFRDEYHLNQRIFHYPKPYIALLDGITMGGGAGISLHGSHRVGTDQLTFAMPETAIGFYPDVGGTYFLPRLAYQVGTYLGLTGAKLSAEDCVAIGLLQQKVAQEDLPALIEALSNTPFKPEEPEKVTAVIESFAQATHDAPIMKLIDSIKLHFSHDTMEAILASLAAERNEFSERVQQQLASKSPTSLKVTLHALQQGRVLSFDDCMQQEFRLTSRFIFADDFAEGIRAVIIDKDQQPKWQPASIEAVTDIDIKRYFHALATEL